MVDAIDLRWLRRALIVGSAVLFIGLSLSAYLAIIGYSIYEMRRFGAANLFLYGLDGALTFPAHLAAGLRGGGSGGGEDGIPVRVVSVVCAALFWGAGAGLVSFLKTKNRSAYWAAAAALLAMAVLSAKAGYLSTIFSK